jgi:hypothetical protein
MQIPLEGYSHAMGVVSNGDNPIGPEIGVRHGTSSSSIGTKVSCQACDTKRSASYRNTPLEHQSGTSNEEDNVASKLKTSSISS